MKKRLTVVLAYIVSLTLLSFACLLVANCWRQIATIAAWLVSGTANVEFLMIVFVIVLVEVHDHARRKNLWNLLWRVKDLEYELKGLRGDVEEMSRKASV